MMRRYCTVDVFTDRPFGGNPLAVVLDAQDLSTQQMQAAAREFGYSETTFVLPAIGAGHDATVRIFSPSSELPFAGHPNIGTAFVVASLAGRDGAIPDGMAFMEAVGRVTLSVQHESGRVRGAELAAPQPFSRGRDVPVDVAAALLSLIPSEICRSRHAPLIASVGLPFMFVELESRAVLARARPDAQAHRTHLPVDGAMGVYLYARGDGDTLHARMFAPAEGIDEDPATGSATAGVVALVADVDRRDTLNLVVHQGDDMGRPSVLRARARRDGNAILAHVGGDCVMVMEGHLMLAGEAEPANVGAPR
jgi:trans-2,3-dihydro-3-hydroxyanthranilate isomerase